MPDASDKAPIVRKRGRPRGPNYGQPRKPDLRKGHTGVLGKRMDPRYIDRAEELFTGIGPEGCPVPDKKILTILMEEFGRSRSQCGKYLRLAKARLRERYGAFDPEACIEQSDIMFLDAFRVAKENVDSHAMTAATHRRAELRGVFVRNSKVTAEIGGLADLFGAHFAELPNGGAGEVRHGTTEKSPEQGEDY